MNSSKLSTLLAVALALTVSGIGCKHKPPGVTNLGEPNSGQAGTPRDPGNAGALGPGSSGPVGMGGGEAATFDPDQMAQDRSALASQTLYFDLDSSTIKSSEQSKLDAVASALRSDSSAKLLIEGHCDERGTEEYNRSLGERRALAARESLATMGVDANRVATRSYGEDRPASSGHDETAWHRNRRDEFVLLHAR
jgi:peptidoglycan-associated lipoprotein